MATTTTEIIDSNRIRVTVTDRTEDTVTEYDIQAIRDRVNAIPTIIDGMNTAHDDTVTALNEDLAMWTSILAEL